MRSGSKKPLKSQGSITARRFDKNAYRLMRSGKIVGLAMLLTNGRWIHTDVDGNQIGKVAYASPRDVAAAANLAVGEKTSNRLKDET